MRRLNSVADSLNTGLAKVDTGEGVTAVIPLEPSSDTIDSGWRSLPANLNGTTGDILLRRQGDQIHIQLNGIVVAPGSYAVYLAAIPAGFVPMDEEYFHAAVGTNVANWQRLGVYGSNRTLLAWVQTAAGTTTRPASPLRGSWSWFTADPVPSTWPGTAV